MKNYLILIAALVLTLASCTIEKRHYRNGYHIEWKGRNETAELVKSNKQVDTEVEAETMTTVESSAVTTSQIESFSEKDVLENTSSEVSKPAVHVVAKRKVSKLAVNTATNPVFQAITKHLPVSSKAKAKIAASGEGWHWGTTAMTVTLGLIVLSYVLFGFGFFLELAMLIFGIIGWSGSNKNGNSGRGWAVAGTVLAAISIFLSLLLLLVFAALVL